MGTCTSDGHLHVHGHLHVEQEVYVHGVRACVAGLHILLDLHLLVDQIIEHDILGCLNIRRVCNSSVDDVHSLHEVRHPTDVTRIGALGTGNTLQRTLHWCQGSKHFDWMNGLPRLPTDAAPKKLYFFSSPRSHYVPQFSRSLTRIVRKALCMPMPTSLRATTWGFGIPVA